MELLKELYCIDAKSGSESKQRKFIENLAKNLKAKTEIDKKGNLYVTKGESETYPCIVAHMDEVHDGRGKDFVVIENQGVLLGYKTKCNEYHGIGADDKNGIWIALKCLEKYDAIKCVFFVEEEIGDCGSREADIKFFDDCRWVVQCDRKNAGDFIDKINGVELCTKEFVKDADLSKYGYKTCDGGLTDVEALKVKGLKVCCCNMSCGYYEPHTRYEHTNFAELQNTLAFVQNIVENLTKVYPHEYKEPKVKKYSSYGGWNNEEWYGGGRGCKYTSPKDKVKEYLEEYGVDDYSGVSMIECWMMFKASPEGRYTGFEIFTEAWNDYMNDKLADDCFEEGYYGQNAV